jgi:hypothetical protein
MSSVEYGAAREVFSDQGCGQIFASNALALFGSDKKKWIGQSEEIAHSFLNAVRCATSDFALGYRKTSQCLRTVRTALYPSKSRSLGLLRSSVP